MPDRLLLQQFIQSRSNAAFEAIVDRYLPLVYNAARRQVCNAALADDVCQTVFMILAQKAASLSANVILPGWLLKTTHLCAMDVLKTESRRKRREQRYAAMSSPYTDPVNPMVESLSAQIDRALSHLKEVDRGAIVLRYFQGHSLNEVAAALNVSEPAATKRVQRALEKLRGYFLRYPVTPSLAALEIVMRGLPHAPPPVSLISSANSIASATTAHSSIITEGAMKFMFWSKAKFAAAIALALLGGATVGTISIVRAQTAAAPAPIPAPAMKPAGSGFTGRLANGVSVELIGVRDFESPRKDWWRADGSPLADAPYDKLDVGGSVTVDIPRKELIKREVVIRVNDKLENNPEPATVVWNLSPSRGSLDGRIVGPHGGSDAPTAASVFYLRRGDSVNLRASIAAGPWQTIVSATPWGASGGSSDNGVSFSYSVSPGMENKGRTNFIFALSASNEPPPGATQIVAVDKTGQEHLCKYGNSASGDRTSAAAFYTDLPLSKIQKLEFQARPYDQWIEIRDICMDPAHATTAKVVTSNDPPEGL